MPIHLKALMKNGCLFFPWIPVLQMKDRSLHSTSFHYPATELISDSPRWTSHVPKSFKARLPLAWIKKWDHSRWCYLYDFGWIDSCLIDILSSKHCCWDKILPEFLSVKCLTFTVHLNFSGINILDCITKTWQRWWVSVWLLWNWSRKDQF